MSTAFKTKEGDQVGCFGKETRSNYLLEDGNMFVYVTTMAPGKVNFQKPMLQFSSIGHASRIRKERGTENRCNEPLAAALMDLSFCSGLFL